ncbi:putative oxidoreductase [Flavobacteriaceae bacterium MAR_2010_188]|nr:putative oxidoreductase [Flavobacteriaceae bacterium MAR_2010_188]
METEFLTDISLLFFRLIIAIIFFSSGKSHFLNPEERSKSIGLSKSATLVLGIAELLGAVFIGIGLFTKIGTILLILAMLGAIYKKIVVWHTKFFEDKGYGWHYDLLLLLCLLIILASGGGNYILFNLI